MYVIHYFGQKRTVCVILKTQCINSTIGESIAGPKSTSYCEALFIEGYDHINLYTVRVAYYEPAYHEHLFIMNQAEGPNGYILIAFVLNKVRLI